MNVEGWAKEVRRLVRALDARGAHTSLSLEQRVHGAAEATKGKPAVAGTLRWSASCVIARADGATADDAASALVATLEKQLAGKIAEHRTELARLEGHQAPGLRLLAADRGEKEKPS